MICCGSLFFETKKFWDMGIVGSSAFLNFCRLSRIKKGKLSYSFP